MKTLSSALPGAIAGVLVLASTIMSDRAAAAERTLDLSVVPMTINQPGTYVVRRDWDLTLPNVSSTAITVMAANVVIDFRGFSIKLSQTGGTAIKIKGASATVRNGSLGAVEEGSYAIRSSGASTIVENMNIYSYAGLPLSGRQTIIRNSTLQGRFNEVHVGEMAVVERNTIGCFVHCATLQGNGIVFQHNRVVVSTEYGMEVRGDHNLVSDNVLSGGMPGEIFTSLIVVGNDNTLARNTVLHQSRTILSVDGSGNTIEGTIAPPPGPFAGPSTYGITFLEDGNFFGNNRLSAQVPFDTNGTVQTDWGGNVAY